MPSELEARILHPRRGRFGRGAETAGIYLLVALALLAELSLVALHPEPDGVLLIGVVLLTIAVAIWLRFVFLVPAVIALWLVPPSVRDAVLGNEDLTWGHAAALAGQLYLACVTRVAYTALRARLLRPGPALPLSDIAVVAPEPVVAAAEVLDLENLPRPADKVAGFELAGPPPLPCGRMLAYSEAKTFLERLIGLDRDLRDSGEVISAILHDRPGRESHDRPIYSSLR